MILETRNRLAFSKVTNYFVTLFVYSEIIRIFAVRKNNLLTLIMKQSVLNIKCWLITSIMLLTGAYIVPASAENNYYEINGIWYQLYGNSQTPIARVVSSFYYEPTDEYKTISYKGNIDIPDVVNFEGTEYQAQIDTYSFYQCDEMVSVTIPSSFTYISYDYFRDCKNLSAVNVRETNEQLCSIDGKVYSKDKTSFLYCPPGVVGEVSVPEGVTSVSGFTGCSKITAIHLPETVTSIGSFSGCQSLKYINIPEGVTVINNSSFMNCVSLSDITLPSSIKYIYSSAFQGCTGLTHIDFPASLECIDSKAFYGCTGITQFDIPAATVEIGGGAFAYCSHLTTINIDPANTRYTIYNGVMYAREYNNSYSNFKVLHTVPAGYTSPATNLQLANWFMIPDKIPIPGQNSNIGIFIIGAYAFAGCTNITRIDMSNCSITDIKKFAFSGCKNIDYMKLGEKVTQVESHAFDSLQCTLIIDHRLSNYNTYDKYLNGGSYISIFQGMSSKATLYVPTSEIQSVLLDYMWGTNYGSYQHYPGKVLPLEPSFGINIVKRYYKGVLFEVVKNMLMENHATLSSVSYNGKVITPNEHGLYYLDKLRPSTVYKNIKVSYQDGLASKTTEQVLKTQDGKFSYSSPKVTQTTATINSLTVPSDSSAVIEKKGIRLDNIEYNMTSKNTIRIDSLKPNTTYKITYFAQYKDGDELTEEQTFRTQALRPKISDIVLKPTSITCTGTYTQGDAKVTELVFDGYESTEGRLVVTGLNPDTEYNLKFIVRTDVGTEEYVAQKVRTTSLVFTNQNPKVTANGVAIVAAKTNIGDEETNVGFEWRKTDAPETVPSKQGAAAIYEGMMEGLLKNLQSGSYYNVRPYYKSATEKMYYGEWVGIDPSDFSYFEPTVHTYDYVEVQEGVAILTGYALPGTDDIVEQGFEYWETQGSNANRRAPQDVQTIVANGQRMTATLTGLKAGTTYGFRAYVKTATNTTYGEERTFNTPAATGIHVVYKNADHVVSPQTFNVYTLSGGLVRQQTTSLEGLPRGIYIVNRKKVIVR